VDDGKDRRWMITVVKEKKEVRGGGAAFPVLWSASEVQNFAYY